MTTADGKPVAKRALRAVIKWKHERTGEPGHEKLEKLMTNDKGVATGKFKVPQGPMKDDNHVEILHVDGRHVYASKRIPIG